VRLLPEIVGAGIAGSFYGWTVSEVTSMRRRFDTNFASGHQRND